jgi:adenylyltransferase/sulfurtransferase
MEVLKLLTGRREALAPKMLVVDLWRNHWRAIDVTALKRAGECPVCDHRQFRWLTGQRGSRVAVLCGRHAVQIRPEQPARIDLANLAAQLREVGPVLCNEYLLKLDVEGHSLTLFADGRAIVQGTDSEAAARGLYARYFGS